MVKDELEAIDYKKAIAKHELENMDNQITILNSKFTLSTRVRRVSLWTQESYPTTNILIMENYF